MAKSIEFYEKQFHDVGQLNDAEEMIKIGDYANARNKLLQSPHFFSLDHVLAMLTLCNILLDSTYHIPGCGIDHYRILRLVPSSTQRDIAFRYTKLLALLRPMNHLFPATELALKFVQEAFLVLSDSEMRSVFDSRKNTLWDAYEYDFEPPAADTPQCSISEMDLVEVAINEEYAVITIADDLSSSSSSSKEVYRDFFDFDQGRNIESMEVGEIWATRDHHRYVQIMGKSGTSLVVMRLKPALHRERRWCEAGHPIGCGSFSLNLDSGPILSSPMELSHRCTWSPGLTRGQINIYPRKGEVWAVCEAIRSSRYRLVEVLSDCSNFRGIECAILEKVEGFRTLFRRHEGISIGVLHLSPSEFYLLSHKLPAIRSHGMWEVDHLSVPNDIISLPYDIARGQVWTISCGKDSMPRQYVVIDSVLPNARALVTFLEPEPSTELEMCWKRKDVPITCGRFELGETRAYLEASELSHLVGFAKSMSSFEIYPARGEIWAMYERWNSDWEVPDCENCQYCIVEIVSDLSDVDKMMVARLEEVKGCLTFFHRLDTDGFSLIREISKSGMLGFSHRIRFCKVPEIESYGIPEDSYHLEPDDLPQKRSNLS